MTTQPTLPPGILRGQAVHAVGLGVLLAGAGAGWSALGRPLPAAFWAAMALPVLHQVFVWLAWRIELGSGATSAAIGFGGYLVLFFALFAGRFVTLLVLAWLDRDSLGLAPAPRIALTTLLAVPALYAGYSVRRYFGMVRAAGADHFDARHREMPLEDRGIFRFTNNGMYLYAFLAFWAIAVAFDSRAALLVAAFSHAYIWVHFFATERPDMRFLYGGAS
ncbi:MAG: methyltransferase [Myxococcota bacterium]